MQVASRTILETFRFLLGLAANARILGYSARKSDRKTSFSLRVICRFEGGGNDPAQGENRFGVVSLHLAKFTDYALRVCLHLGAHAGQRMTIAEIAKSQKLSHPNLMKVVQRLVEGGFLLSTRGRSGGVQLSDDAAAIRIGAIVRHMEEDTAIVDCSSCVSKGACGLLRVLNESKQSFLKHLDQVTLSDVLKSHPASTNVLGNLASPAA